MSGGFNWDRARVSSLIGGRGYDDLSSGSRNRQEDEEHKKWLKKMRKRAKALEAAKNAPTALKLTISKPSTDRANVSKRPMKSAFHADRTHNIIDSDEVPWDE